MSALPTPGPWRWGKQLGGTLCVSPDTTRPGRRSHNGHMQIAAFYGPDAVANARLVAASPRLAAALLALLEWGREHTSPTDANTPHALLIEAAAALDDAGGEDVAR